MIKIDDPVFWSKLLKERQEASLDRLYVFGGWAMIAEKTALEKILKEMTDIFIHGILSIGNELQTNICDNREQYDSICF
ncbi:MAG: hypothetical protein PHR66_10215 [Desulfuromonadaceae bacterium]|nr:hypothetical protein [Desulfuromonadaceae bacterium]